MKRYIVSGYGYSELDDKAKHRVRIWLNECPFEYQDDEGITFTEYFSDWNEDDLSEHCKINDYIFDRWGRVLHSIIEEAV